MSGGVALFDFDNDKLIDIYFVDSLTVDTAKDLRALAARCIGIAATARSRTSPTKRVSAIQAGAWVSAPPTLTATAGKTCMSRRSAATSCIATTVTPRSRTSPRMLASPSVGGHCGFADYDRDADLDLFVSRYVKVDLGNLPQFGKDKTCEYRGISVQCGPRRPAGESDVLCATTATASSAT